MFEPLIEKRLTEEELIRNFVEIHRLDLISMSPVTIRDQIMRHTFRPHSFEDMVQQVNTMRTQWLR